MEKKNEKIAVGLLTIVILALVLLAGPTKAFVLDLNANKDLITKGEEITFNVTLEIQNIDEYLPIENLRLELTGPTSSVCEFDINGIIISGCEAMTIAPINAISENNKGYGYGYGYDSATGYGYDFGYGYGYGYGYGIGEMFLKYQVTLNTQNYTSGNYESTLKALIGDKIFESKDKPIFTINDFITLSSFGTSGSGGKYKISSNDSVEESPISKSNNESDELPEPTKPENQSEEEKGLISRITGGVIGAVGSTTGMIVIVLILGLSGAFVGVRVVRLKKLRHK